MSTYVKLFASILDSTVWKLPPAITKVWVTMMAMADRDGIVEASIPGLADRARVPLQTCEKALEVFLSPDPYSKSKDQDGKRIEEVPRGWRLINFESYRELQSVQDRRQKDADRQQRWRDRHKEDAGVTLRNDPSHAVTVGRRSCSASESSSGLAGSSNPDPEGARSNANATPLTGYEVQRLFGEIRSRVVGGLPWQSVKVATGVATSMAEMLNSDPALRYDLEPTIELLFRKAKAGEAGSRSRDIVRHPSFAFAAWCSEWTALREELHGLAPDAPPPPPEKRVEAFAVAQERQRKEAALDAKVERTLEELRPRAPPVNPREDYLRRKKAEAEAQATGKAVAT